MDSRRDFLKKAALLTGGVSLTNLLPSSIQKAMAISAAPGTTFYDAEHVVFLMQENRSFDHMFGSLKGVRGFNNPHPYRLPNQNKVWLQQDKKGNTYPPFHLDLNQTKITWQGGLAHSWPDQTAARNKGKYDQWVPVKSLMAMGHYKRQDLPFYYALADAFTVCDHSFCSSITGTTPNRLFFFTGANTANPEGGSEQIVMNGQAESRDGMFVDWQTLPEVLEDNGVDWRVYQNELWTSALPEEQDDWVGNYGDNPLEYVKRYHVRLSAYFRKHGDQKQQLSAAEVTAKYHALSQREKNLIDKAFTTNIENPDYLDLAPFAYKDEKGLEQKMAIPKADLFYQFRKDVNEGKLPAVSWLVAPQRFSDHTSSPLYGTWYVSEAMDILTQNPEVWKKTIFILTYDENDGYFDHIPPFVVPKPNDASAGAVSKGIHIAADYHVKDDAPIGLGYRIPMVVASPWSKGGFVNSEVFDHTSSVQFLENWLSKKLGKKIFNPQLTSWRRAICGDLTSVFRPYHGEEIQKPVALQKDQVIATITNAKNKPKQYTPAALTHQEIEQINASISNSADMPEVMPKQEAGTKPACAIPYQFDVNAVVEGKKLTIIFKVAQHSTGVPFLVNARNAYQNKVGSNWNFAVTHGDTLSYEWDIEAFENQQYHLAVHAPNGFYREFRGGIDDSIVINSLNNGKGALVLQIANKAKESKTVDLNDYGYGINHQKLRIAAGRKKILKLELDQSSHWYAFDIESPAVAGLKYRFAGHLETTKISATEPLMAGV